MLTSKDMDFFAAVYAAVLIGIVAVVVGACIMHGISKHAVATLLGVAALLLSSWIMSMSDDNGDWGSWAFRKNPSCVWTVSPLQHLIKLVFALSVIGCISSLVIIAINLMQMFPNVP